MSDEEGEFQGVVTSCLASLLLGVETRLEGALSAMGRVNWGAVEAVSRAWAAAALSDCISCCTSVGAAPACSKQASSPTAAPLSPSLRTMQVGDQSEWVGAFRAALGDVGGRLGASMPPNYFRFFCDRLLRSFGPRLLDAVFRCRKISEAGCQQVRGVLWGEGAVGAGC